MCLTLSMSRSFCGQMPLKVGAPFKAVFVGEVWGLLCWRGCVYGDSKVSEFLCLGLFLSVSVHFSVCPFLCLSLSLFVRYSPPSLFAFLLHSFYRCQERLCGEKRSLHFLRVAESPPLPFPSHLAPVRSPGDSSSVHAGR